MSGALPGLSTGPLHGFLHGDEEFVFIQPRSMFAMQTPRPAFPAAAGDVRPFALTLLEERQSLAGSFLDAFDPAQLVGLESVSRQRCKSLLARLRELRNDEICAESALAVAQQELDTRSEDARRRVLHEDEPHSAGEQAVAATREAVEQAERDLVFVRAAIQDLVDEIGRRVASSGRGRLTA